MADTPSQSAAVAAPGPTAAADDPEAIVYYWFVEKDCARSKGSLALFNTESCCSKASHKPRRGTCAGGRKRPMGATRVRAQVRALLHSPTPFFSPLGFYVCVFQCYKVGSV